MRAIGLLLGLVFWSLAPAQADECMDKAVAQAEMDRCAAAACLRIATWTVLST